MTRREIDNANQFSEKEQQSILCSQGAGTSGTSTTAVDKQASAIARVPEDILLIVFEKVVGDNDWDEKLLEGNLWTIVAVSKRWRALALSCAGLWSKIHLTFPQDYYRDDEEEGFDYYDWAPRCCRRTKLQLERSGQHPLEVALNTRVLKYHDGGESDRAFLRQLLVSLARSTTIDLSGSASLLRQKLPSQTPKTYPLLHTLRVDTTRHDIFVEVPALRHISIFATGTPSPHLCANITTLEFNLCYTTPSNFVELLRHTKQLEKLFITSLGLPAEYQRTAALLVPPVTQIAHLERLQELDIAFDPAEFTRVPRAAAFVASIVLQHIRIPNVESIRLTKPSPDDLSILKQCISVSGNTSSVVKLNIWSIEEGLYQIGSLLAGLPGLQTLLVFEGKAEGCRALCDVLIWTDEPSSENTLLENPSPPETAELQKPPPRVNVCPKLQRVIFNRSKLDSRSLQAMVTGRMGNPSAEQLQSVDVKHSEFTNDPPPSGNHLDWLHDLQAPLGPLVPSSIKW